MPMKKLLPLFLFLLTASMAFAYQATIFGYVKEANGTAVPNVPVLVKIVSNNGLLQSQTVLTQGNGKYIAVFTLDDAILEAKAIIEVQDCNNIELSKTVGFSKNNPNADAHFTWCASGCELEVKIEKIVNNSGSSVLKAVVMGGTAPFTYTWSSGQNSQSIEISPNHKYYCVTVTDQNGCTGKACVVLENQDDCAVEIEKVALDNAGTKFTLKAVTKGSGPFTYKWSNGADGPTIMVTESGTYCVTITSADGCTAQDCITVEIKGNSDCGVEIVKVPANTPNGQFTLKAIAKGVAPFTYNWNTGATTPTIVMEKPGEYCVNITDANGCEAKTCFVWKEGGDCGVEIKVVYDGGKAKLSAVAKGAAPFTYHWSKGATTPTIVVEKPGEYCVNITDANGCESKACVQVKFSNTLDCQVKILVLPTKDPGIVKLVALANPSGNVKYAWSNGANTPFILVEIPGEYCVNVTNAAGCEAKACVKLPEAPNKDCGVEIAKLPASTPNGKFSLKAIAKGVAPFTYKWNTGATTQIIEIEKPGEYCVVVTDANGCEAKACLVIKGKDEGPKDCAVHIKLKPLSNTGDGFALYAVAKGTPPFKFIWSTGETGQQITVVESGLYCVTVTNDAGCEAVTCLEIDKDGFTGSDPNETGFKIINSYPVPSTTEINYVVQMPSESSLMIEVVNLKGELVRQVFYDLLDQGQHLLQVPIHDLATGIYVVRLITPTEVITTKLIRKEG